MRTIDNLQLVRVAVTQENRRPNSPSLILQGTGDTKLALTDPWSARSLSPAGGELVIIEELHLDSCEEDPTKGRREYVVERATRKLLGQADGISWTNNRYFFDCESSLLARAIPPSSELYQLFDDAPLHTRCLFDGIKLLITRMWAFTELPEEEIIRLVSRPALAIREIETYEQRVGTMRITGYLWRQFNRKEKRWELMEGDGEDLTKAAADHPLQAWIKRINEQEQLKRERYPELQRRVRATWEKHTLWKWFQSQPMELRERLCRQYWAKVPTTATDFLEALRPMTYTSGSSLQPVSLLNNQPVDAAALPRTA